MCISTNRVIVSATSIIRNDIMNADRVKSPQVYRSMAIVCFELGLVCLGASVIIPEPAAFGVAIVLGGFGTALFRFS
jgi:hypothetical protein